MRCSIVPTYTHEPGLSFASWLNIRSLEHQAPVEKISPTISHDFLSLKTSHSDKNTANNSNQGYRATVATNYHIRESTPSLSAYNPNNNIDNNEVNKNNDKNGETRASVTASRRKRASLRRNRRLVAGSFTHEPGVSYAFWLNIRSLEHQVSVRRTFTTISPVTNVNNSSGSMTTDTSQETADNNTHTRHVTVANNYFNNSRQVLINGPANSTDIPTNNNINNDNNIAFNNENRNSVTDNWIILRFVSPENRRLINSLLDRLDEFLLFLVLLFTSIHNDKSQIVQFFILSIIFGIVNTDLKSEIAKNENRSLSILFAALNCIYCCFILIAYIFQQPLFKFYIGPITPNELLWSVIITDVELKLLTVALKILVTCLPAKIVPYSKRGKYYLVLEACSRLVRTTATIYPWVSYVRVRYYNPAKPVLCQLFTVIYISKKLNDIMKRGTLVKSSWEQFLQDATVDTNPSEDELVRAGSVCTICHDNFSNPLLLHCKHIFCEPCLTAWLVRDPTCPLCRAPTFYMSIAYINGNTSEFIQWY